MTTENLNHPALKDVATELEADDIPSNHINNHINGNMLERTEITASLETPFLPPKFVEEYERIVPGSGKEMFDMIVRQQDFNIELRRHHMALEERNMRRIEAIDEANIIEQNRASNVRERELTIKARGQIFALILACLLIGVSAYFAYLQQPWLASIPVTTIVGVITVMFLQRRFQEHHDNDNDDNQDK